MEIITASEFFEQYITVQKPFEKDKEFSIAFASAYALAYHAAIKQREVDSEMKKLSLSPRDIAERLRTLYCAQESINEASQQQSGHTGDKAAPGDLP